MFKNPFAPSGTLVTGYFDRGNAGDNMMLRGYVQNTPLGESSISARRLPPLRRSAVREVFAFVGEVLRCKKLVFVGGTSIRDTRGRSDYRVLVQYLGLSLFARLSGSTIEWHAIGVGPVTSRVGRKLAGRIVSLANVVAVRDAPSENEALDLGVRASRVCRRSDLALSLNSRGSGKANRVPGRLGAALVGETIGSWHPFEGLESIHSFLERIRSLLPSGQVQPVLLLVFYAPDDLRLAEALSLRFPGSYDIVDLSDVDPATVLETVGTLEGILAMRYHSLVAAHVSGTPLLYAPYERKVDDLAKELSLPRSSRVPLCELTVSSDPTRSDEDWAVSS